MSERNFRHFCHSQRDGGTSRQGAYVLTHRDTSAGVSLKDTQRLCRPHSNVRDWQAWVQNKAERHPSKEKAARVRTPRSSRLPRSFTEVVLLKGRGRALKALGYIRPTEVTSVALTHISGAQASRPYDPYAETSTREVSGGRSAPETSYPVDRTHRVRRETRTDPLLSTDLPIWRRGPFVRKLLRALLPFLRYTDWIGHFHADQ